MKYVLQGVVSDGCCADDNDGVGICGVPLAMWSENNFDSKNVTVRWWMSDDEMSEHDRLNTVAAMQVGLTSSEFYGGYSELSGHLGTHEGFQVGGHDMLEIMRQHLGKWCYVEVEVNEPS